MASCWFSTHVQVTLVDVLTLFGFGVGHESLWTRHLDIITVSAVSITPCNTNTETTFV